MSKNHAQTGRIVENVICPTRDCPAKIRYAVVELPVDKIDPDPNQPRRDLGNLEDLASSIRKLGLLEPILLRPIDKTGRFRVIFGERRLAAARLAGRDRIPAFLADSDEQTAILMQWVENAMRKDLHPLEEATAIDRLRKCLSQSVRWLAEEMGMKHNTLSDTLKLLDLPDDIKEEARNTPSVGKTILLEIAREEDPVKQRKMWDAAKRGTTSRRIRKDRVRAPAHPHAPSRPTAAEIRAALEGCPLDELARILEDVLPDQLARDLCGKLVREHERRNASSHADGTIGADDRMGCESRNSACRKSS